MRSTARGPLTAFEFRGAAGLEALSVTCRFDAPQPDVFRARLRSILLGSVRVDELVASEHSCERSRENIVEEPLDTVTIGAVVSGAVREGGVGGVMVRPGDLVVQLNTRPHRYTALEETRLVAAEIPLAMLGVSPRRLATVGGQVDGTSPLASTFAALLRGVVDAHTSSPLATESLERATVDLARTLLAEQFSRDAASPRDEAMQRAQQYLELRYANPSLDAARAASDLGMSLRQLHRLFEEQPTTFGRYLRGLRLQHLADALTTTDLPFRELVQAAGFGSVDAAERAFRQEFGRSSADYRRTFRESVTPSGIRGPADTVR